MEKQTNCDFCKQKGSIEEGYIIKMIIKHPEGDFALNTCPDCYNQKITKNLTKKAKNKLNYKEE